jgi:hypothetical protein
MSPQNLSFLISRFIALIVMGNFLFVLPQTLSMLVGTLSAPKVDLTSTLIVGTLGTQLANTFVIDGVVAFIFWFKAEWIAKKIAGKLISYDVASSQKTVDIQSTCFTVIGIFLIVIELPDLFGEVVRLLIQPPNLGVSNTIGDVTARLASPVIGFIIGMVLVWRAPRLTRVIDVIRKAS